MCGNHRPSPLFNFTNGSKDKSYEAHLPRSNPKYEEPDCDKVDNDRNNDDTDDNDDEISDDYETPTRKPNSNNKAGEISTSKSCYY